MIVNQSWKNCPFLGAKKFFHEFYLQFQLCASNAIENVKFSFQEIGLKSHYSWYVRRFGVLTYFLTFLRQFVLALFWKVAWRYSKIFALQRCYGNAEILLQVLHCERSELRLYFEWTKVHYKCQNIFNFGEFSWMIPALKSLICRFSQRQKWPLLLNFFEIIW